MLFLQLNDIFPPQNSPYLGKRHFFKMKGTFSSTKYLLGAKGNFSKHKDSFIWKRDDIEGGQWASIKGRLEFPTLYACSFGPWKRRYVGTFFSEVQYLNLKIQISSGLKKIIPLILVNFIYYKKYVLYIEYLNYQK